MDNSKALDCLNVICDLDKKKEFVPAELLVAPDETFKPRPSTVGCKKDISFAKDRMVMRFKRS